MKHKNIVELAQEKLDEGFSRNKTAEMLGVHHKTIDRLYSRGFLEIYIPFDEDVDKKHLYQNFEWLWEEDQLERFFSDAFELKEVVISRSDENFHRVGKYVLEKYGGIHGYIQKKNLNPLSEFILYQCSTCNKQDSVSSWYKDKRKLWGLYYECPECRANIQKRYFDANPLKMFLSNEKRRVISELLPISFSTEEWVELRKRFDWRCALSGSYKQVTIDHFIPIVIGHGGTYKGNLIPLSKGLNSSKRENEPFEWSQKRKINSTKFKDVVNYLSFHNSLTPYEYFIFVKWCFRNKRSVNQIEFDKRHSIEQWREATGQHFPLPAYALNEIGNRLTETPTEAGYGNGNGRR